MYFVTQRRVKGYLAETLSSNLVTYLRECSCRFTITFQTERILIVARQTLVTTTSTDIRLTSENRAKRKLIEDVSKYGIVSGHNCYALVKIW